MAPQYLSLVKLLCLLGAIFILPRAGALLCYEATASLFRAVTLHNWKWQLLRSMVCQLREGCEETLLFIETGTKRGVVGFKGCTSALSYPPQMSYLVSPPGVSVASYSRVCRSYLCNNLTNLNPIVKLKANTVTSKEFSSNNCPTCVGMHTEDCLPNFISVESCPQDATVCYSSTLKFQAGLLNSTILLMGCTHYHQRLLVDFRTVGSIRVTEVRNVLERAQIVSAESSRPGPACGLLLGLLLAFRD
ncbi:PREDICTED: ly6/PLAUR domain-containing protein 4 [Chrysochloris asiatica]|uniref:Ly6/PLAUR domain-containing protein 4 n=1 Tax=Chrysochloris asiatica TaxID=185453 RepID=A0A9B0TW36_CHRAS|nr:PREDICTED: ly6/PLAUR domain-containing protein 4 [Chrysochloris asiatica]